MNFVTQYLIFSWRNWFSWVTIICCLQLRLMLPGQTSFISCYFLLFFKSYWSPSCYLYIFCSFFLCYFAYFFSCLLLPLLILEIQLRFLNYLSFSFPFHLPIPLFLLPFFLLLFLLLLPLFPFPLPIPLLLFFLFLFLLYPNTQLLTECLFNLIDSTVIYTWKVFLLWHSYNVQSLLSIFFRWTAVKYYKL